MDLPTTPMGLHRDPQDLTLECSLLHPIVVYLLGIHLVLIRILDLQDHPMDIRQIVSLKKTRIFIREILFFLRFFSGSASSPMPPVSTQSSSTPASTAPPPTTPSNASGPLGPDGFDESSQQSTLSQSSDRSDSGRQTPKQNTPGGGPPGSHPGHPAGQQQQPGPHNFMGNFNHPPGSPHSSAPSPGGSMGSGPENPGYPRDGMASPSWQRPPASPVSTPQVREIVA